METTRKDDNDAPRTARFLPRCFHTPEKKAKEDLYCVEFVRLLFDIFFFYGRLATTNNNAHRLSTTTSFLVATSEFKRNAHMTRAPSCGLPIQRDTRFFRLTEKLHVLLCSASHTNRPRMDRRRAPE